MDTNYILGSNGELYHWGTKGMKWGIRRYQNKDGSLTPAGKKRYAKEEAALKEREKSIKTRERTAAKLAKLDAKKAELDARENALNGSKTASKKPPEAPKPKSIKDMSDDELRELTNRMNLEKNYYDARKNLAAANPKPKKFTEKFMEKYMGDIVNKVVIDPGKSYVEKLLKNKFGPKDPTISDLLKKYGDMSEADRKRYQNAAAVKTWEYTILGKKNK